MLTPEQETERKARDLADSLGIPIWITDDGRIEQNKPESGGTEIVPRKQARPTPHGSPNDYSAK